MVYVSTSAHGAFVGNELLVLPRRHKPSYLLPRVEILLDFNELSSGPFRDLLQT